MLPYIEREQGLHPLIDDRRVGVVERGDLQRAAVQHQPGPAVREMADRLVLQPGEQGIGATERLVDQTGEAALRLLALGRGETLPEETVVPVLRGIVE